MITVTDFTAGHMGALSGWLKEHNLNLSFLEELPKIGCVASADGSPICAGFLRMVEGNFGMLDGFITDPKAGPLSRHSAIEMVADKLFWRAWESGIRRLIIITEISSIVKRAEARGFKKTQQTTLSKVLEE